MLNDRHDAYRLLKELGAPGRLLIHLQLVAEAADLLMQAYAGFGIEFDAQLIELGVAVHDAGKVRHPEELDQPGSRHEPAGEALMLRYVFNSRGQVIELSSSRRARIRVPRAGGEVQRTGRGATVALTQPKAGASASTADPAFNVRLHTWPALSTSGP